MKTEPKQSQNVHITTVPHSDAYLTSLLVPEAKRRMLGVREQMSQDRLLFGLKLCKRVLKITDNMSRTLQKQSLSAAEAQDIAALTAKTLKNMRTDEAFGLF